MPHTLLEKINEILIRVGCEKVESLMYHLGGAIESMFARNSDTRNYDILSKKQQAIIDILLLLRQGSENQRYICENIVKLDKIQLFMNQKEDYTLKMPTGFCLDDSPWSKRIENLIILSKGS